MDGLKQRAGNFKAGIVLMGYLNPFLQYGLERFAADAAQAVYKRQSFNCSTGTALTLAGMGYQVVKHGNRAVSSKCGSADALEGLGVNLDVNPAEVGKILHAQNFVFLFAQRFHPCFRNIAPIRNELGIRTLFNLLGPLINPSRPTHILLGVARPNLVKLMAETLAQSSVHRAAVVCGCLLYTSRKWRHPRRGR